MIDFEKSMEKSEKYKDAQVPGAGAEPNNMKFQKPLNKNKEMLGFHGSMKNNRMHGLNKTMKN